VQPETERINGPLVVIVDSDTETAHELSHGLAALGFDVRGPASTLAAARDLLDLVTPDIALICAQLADGENGLALARELAGRGSRVVMMGNGPSPWPGDYIRKPFDVDSMIGLLASSDGIRDPR
jgi:ActR/RegA family two-component response regulator